MVSYLGRRLLLLLPTAAVPLLLVFFMLRLAPGDPASILAGDQATPEQVEALRHELGYFVECISSGHNPHNDGCAGLRVVKMLEAATESLSKRGALVYL